MRRLQSHISLHKSTVNPFQRLLLEIELIAIKSHQTTQRFSGMVSSVKIVVKYSASSFGGIIFG